MTELFYDYYDCPIGMIKVTATNQYLIMCQFCSAREEKHPNSITELTCLQLEEYFTFKRCKFDIAYQAQGTLFQQEVWKKLAEIPYGKTFHYSDIARMLKKEKAVRAVAHAIGQNPLLIIIPCHRVVGKDSTLHGYKAGIERKQYLLDMEYPQ